MRIEILKDTIAQKVSISIEDGKMKINKEEVKLKSGDVFDGNENTSIRPPKDNKIEIKMSDNSSLTNIPAENVKIEQNTRGSNLPKRKKGCGGCAQKRKRK
tara:strand:+ start:4395 stop:4697 length:303 start_codon:yes stop_codon:yes gene_type:complete